MKRREVILPNFKWDTTIYFIWKDIQEDQFVYKQGSDVSGGEILGFGLSTCLAEKSYCK